MRKNLYRIAIVIAVVAFIPLIVFIAGRESPPEKIKVETHRKQVIKQFRLESKEKIEWELTAPEAEFKGDNVISLKNPRLLILLKHQPPITIKSPSALYFRKEKRIELKHVLLQTDNLTAESPCGVYYVDSALFKTDCGCKILLKGANSITGKICTLNLREKKITISNNVKSVFREVKR